MRSALLSAAVGFVAAQPPVVNVRPIIGILSVPFNESVEPCDTIARSNGITNGISCFSAQYRQWASIIPINSTTDADICTVHWNLSSQVEAAGARTAVIPYDADAATLDALLSGLNGVLFTG